MPGQPNTCSTTTEPPMMWGMCPSTVVSTGVSAPRKAWRTMTARSPRPLARAVRTWSAVRFSATSVRVRRST